MTNNNWHSYYVTNTVSADDAVDLINSGDTVIFGHAVNEPAVLTDALVKNAEKFRDVTVMHLFSIGRNEYAGPEYKEHFTFRGLFISGGTRRAVNEGYGDYVPVFLHEVPIWIRRGMISIDVAMVTVTPPDEHGFCSLGVSSDYTVQAVRSADIVLAEVNSNMPFVYGDNKIHVTEIDRFVQSDRPIGEILEPDIGEKEETIGKYCAELIEDGSTLQVGIGAIPNAVMEQLHDKKHLGIHSEMVSDGIMKLAKAGVIDGSQKTIGNGKITATFLMGTKQLYEYAHMNPQIEVRTADYVNHPITVAQNHKMVCVNGAIQVDLMGQVMADTIGYKQFSGVGGQVDFIRGAAMSQDGMGKSIIAMPSVAVKKDGTKISKIVPLPDEGSAVTTSRNDVDYIVTEYGIARLKGLSLKERSKALIKIAHPDFRDWLEEQHRFRFKGCF